MNELTELRKKLMEHWDVINKLGGEWNAGYEQALRYSMSLIYDAIRNLELNEQPYKGSIPKGFKHEHDKWNPNKKDNK